MSNSHHGLLLTVGVAAVVLVVGVAIGSVTFAGTLTRTTTLNGYGITYDVNYNIGAGGSALFPILRQTHVNVKIWQPGGHNVCTSSFAYNVGLYTTTTTPIGSGT